MQIPLALPCFGREVQDAIVRSGYGDRKIEEQWLASMKRALASVRAPSLTGAERSEVTLEFKVWPDNPAYRGNARPHGPDLDNLVKLTIDGLTPHRSRDGEYRGVGVIPNDPTIHCIAASKELVHNADKTGVLMSISTSVMLSFT